MNAPAVSIKVAKRFHELRRRYLTVRIGIVLSIAVAALIAIWMTLSVCDYLWEWPAAYRTASALTGGAAVFVWLGSRLFAIGRDSRQRRFASAIEDSFHEFGQRIRTVLETVDGRVSGPEEMLAALGHQTLGRWETLTPAQMIPKRMLLACGAVALAAVLLAIGFLTSGGDMKTAMLRSLGNEIPYTHLNVTPGNTRVLEGTPIEVSLELTGRTNRDVLLRYRVITGDEESKNESSEVVAKPSDTESDDGEDWIENELLPTDSDAPADVATSSGRQALFAAALGKAKQPVEYQFVTSVATTPVYRVDVQPLIEARRIETNVQPPEYTQLENRSFTTADVTVLERSLVNVTIETNHPLGEAQLEVGETPSKLQPVDIAATDDATQWTFLLPTDESIHWRFTGSGPDGTPMQPVAGRLRVRHDGAPKLTWRDPAKEMRVHTLAELPMQVQVSDDYGIAETGIVFQLGGDEEYVLTDWTAAEDTDNKTRLRLEEILPLESFELTVRDYIAYYAYAVDNRQWAPQRSESDIRYIDIRPLRQLYSEVDGGACNCVLVPLSEIIRRQRVLINRTRRLVNSSSVDLAKQLGTIDQMVEAQSELAGLTRMLADFLASRGNDDVEALNQAEAAMLQAVDSLAAGSFDLALVQEEDALRALAEARRILEIRLNKNPTPKQALRRFGQRIDQKLRRARPKPQQQIANTLQQMAQQQMQLSQTACSICAQSGSQGQNNPSGKSGQGGTANSNRQGSQGSQGKQKRDAESSKTYDPNQQGADPEQNNSQNDQTAANNGKQSDAENEGTRDEGTQGADAQDPDSEKGDLEKGDAEKGEGEDENIDTDGSGSDREDQSGDGAADQPSLKDQREQLYAKQIDLLQRLQDIEAKLTDRLNSSSLLAQRMEATKASMDLLAKQARDGQLEKFGRGSGDTAEQLREMGLQVKALGSGEPIARVSSIRDMTTALAKMESELAKQLNSTSSSGAAGKADAENNPNTPGRLGKRMQRRAETIEDALKAPGQSGDVETSKVNDSLQRFAEETGFLQQLDETRNAGEMIAGRGETGEKSEDEPSNQDKQGDGAGDSSRENEQQASPGGLDRAAEYAEAARMLDELYRELVSPRLARLRKLEQQANQLAQQSGSAGRQNEDSESDPETQAGIRQLQRELDEEGLGGLAEMLDSSEWTDAEVTQKANEIREGGTANVQTQRRIDGRGINLRATRLALISIELQKRIQEMVLREISADRDVPVPAQYRRAVDRYFRILAGEANTDRPTPAMTGAAGNTMKPAGVE